VFETLDGRQKRRLCPPPYAWAQRSEQDLEALLMRAETLLPRGQVRVRDDVLLPADLPPNVPMDIADAMPRDFDGGLDMRYLGVVRSFRFPGGEIWRASVVELDPDMPLILRFSSATHSIDLTSWPPDWIDLTDEQLVALLREGASTRDRRRDPPPARRHDDPRPDADAR
jgi:hypothetical protein